MSLFTQVDPAAFINVAQSQPATGRGAWTKSGIGFDYRYRMPPDGSTAPKIGTTAEQSLSAWAVAAGSYAIQTRLVGLGFMDPVGDGERGVYGPRTTAAVKAFQAASYDPDGNVPLVVDGIVGRSDARALFTPLLNAAEKKYSIPGHYLRGECNHESILDPGAIGYYIFYPEFRGVDRGAFQINSAAVPDVTWEETFDFAFAAGWSAQRMRANHDGYARRYPDQDDDVLWKAAILSHNNPSAGGMMARLGYPPYDTSAAYINAVLAAIY